MSKDRVLALDVGRNKTGMAISENILGLVSPLKPIFVNLEAYPDKWFGYLSYVLNNTCCPLHEISTVVIGSWKDCEHKNLEMEKLVKRAIGILKSKTDWRVVLTRETYTSSESREILRGMGVGVKRRYRSVDSYAASLLLIDYLELIKPMEERNKVK